MKLTWQPYRERLWVTAARTFTIAIVLGAITSRSMGGGIAGWAKATVLMLWPAFGGHWVEIFFLNVVRPRLPNARTFLVVMRLIVWFVGGTLLAIGMGATAVALSRQPPWPRLIAFGGVVFIGVELVAHLVLHVRGRPSFYNARG